MSTLKHYVRDEEGAVLYSMCQKTFEKCNLSQQERNSIKKVIEEIEKSLGGGCDER